MSCHVIVELKIDRFRHEYASQLNMYLNYYKSEVMQHDDNPPVGILLCPEKGDTLFCSEIHVRASDRGGNKGFHFKSRPTYVV